MSKIILMDFRKETGIEVRKDELINLKNVYEKVFFRAEEKNKKNLEGNYQRWSERNLISLKCEDSGNLYFEENKDYIKVINQTKGRARTDYFISKRTAELILLKANTELGKKLLNKLLDLFHNLEDYKTIRFQTGINYRPLTDAIQSAHDPAKFYHYSNEADLINRIVTGYTAKQYREKYLVENIRDNLTPAQIKLIDKLQILNTAFIELGWTFEQRKKELQDYSERKIVAFVNKAELQDRKINKSVIA